MSHDALWLRVQSSFDRQGLMQHLGARLLRVGVRFVRDCAAVF
jgi:hypothetical protein